MTIQSIALPTANRDPEYYAGRADAYDEHGAGATVDTLEDRYEWMTDPTQAQHPHQLISTAYLSGYKAYIQDLRAEQYGTWYRANAEYTAWLEAH